MAKKIPIGLLAGAAALFLLARPRGGGSGAIPLWGSTSVPLQVQNGRWSVVHLHADEQDALGAAQAMAPELGLRVISLDPGRNERGVSFPSEGRTFTFDPNRIFERTGVENTLRATDGGTVPGPIVAAVMAFGQLLLSRIQSFGGPIISVHNNTPGNLTIDSFTPGINATDVSRHSASDPDDFFLVTSQRLFDAFSQLPRNVVLERLPQSDGSLSYVAQELGIPYVNIEAQHGNLATQKAMLRDAVGVLQALYADAIA